MNICFVANFYKTFFFHELAKHLTAAGVNIYWVVTKRDQYDFLENYYGKTHVLYLNRSDISKPSEPVGDFRINELLFGDRVLKYELINGQRFLTNIQRPIVEFLSTNAIRFVFGEITWAHELLIQRITKSISHLQCKYLDCSMVRIPNRRFAFFGGEVQYELMELDATESTNAIFELTKPSYLLLNDRIVANSSSLKGRIGRLKRFFSGENIESLDPNVIVNPIRRLRVAAQEEINRALYRKVRATRFDEVKDEKYIFVGFHKQPESSIDVSGRYYENQFLNLVNLWRLLPRGWKILVKEHTNAIGDRSLFFYKKLQKFPGIVIVEASTDSRSLIERSELVATVSGTIAYEAALLGKPSITFGKVFFNRINFCKFVTIDDLIKYRNLSDLVDELKSALDNRLEFSNYLLKHSFEGYVTDPVTDPTVLDETNLRQVCKGFLLLFARNGNEA